MLSLYPPSAFDAYKKDRTHFSASIDAAVEQIHAACEGIGTDDKALVEILGSRSPNERGLISLRYKELHGQSLRDLIKSETSGDFGYLLQLNCFTLPQAEAYILFHAMKGAGTSDHLLYSVLMGRTNEEMDLLKKAYFEMYDTDLAVGISDEISGDFLAAIMKELQEPLLDYKPSFHTKEKAAEDAELIYKAGEGKWGTDENNFIKVLLASPPAQLRNIEAAYETKYQHGLVYAIENEFSGSACAALTFFVRLSLEPWIFLAEHIEGTMAGMGTDETALSAAIVRYHSYLGHIMPAYEKKYKMSLHDRIQGEGSGKYQELLLQLIDGPRSVGNFAYVTKPFDEVRYDVVARQLNQLGVVMNAVHYFDTFDRANLRLVDGKTQADFDRDDVLTLSFTTFLARANIRRAELLNRLPQDVLALRVNTMIDMHAPLCGQSSSSWETPPQVLFGNWFPTIHHEFCRDFHTQFPLDRFFDRSKAPIDANLADVGSVTLGLISVVNMSEVYLRQFTDSLVIRKIMKNVQEGYLGLELPEYTDAVADAVVSRYKKGIAVADVVALLPGSIDSDHVALVDVLGVSALLTHYLTPQQLTVGFNVNKEPAILAEVTHATASFVTPDFLIDSVGMHYVSTVHAAPYWACAIKHTSMDKSIKVEDVDGATIKQCGSDQTATLPVFIVNLMYLYQSKQRDYTKMDNTTIFALGRRRESDADYIPLSVPETFGDSTLLSIDGSTWSKEHKDTPQSLSETPYGYAFTPDCQGLVDKALQQTGRNVQKYQAYLGDGLGNCAYQDSQEISPQTLCRLFMTAGELLYRSLDGNLLALPVCSSLLTAGANDEMVALELENLREVEWFMIETTFVSRIVRIQDNTSRQIRTFLLMLNLLGAASYSCHYIFILWSVWTFIRNSVYRPAAALSRHGTSRNVFIHIQEFVSLHCAAGAHANLQRIKWGADRGITDIEEPRGTPRVLILLLPTSIVLDVASSYQNHEVTPTVQYRESAPIDVSMQHIFTQAAHDVFHNVPLEYSREIDDACEQIRSATDGLGVDEKVLVSVLSSLSVSDRSLVIYRYKDLYREELKDTLSRDTVGDFRFLLLLFTMPLPEGEAFLLNVATVDRGTKERLLYPILLGRTNEEISIIKATYYYIFNKDLVYLMRSELSGDFRKVILMALDKLQVNYDPKIHTYEKAKADAALLYDAGENRWGTDEKTFIRVLFSSPREHLVVVNDIYKKKYVSDLEDAVRGEFSGYAAESLVFYVHLALEPDVAIARLLERTMKGLGTDEKGLSAAVIRYHWMEPQIEDTYEKLYGRSLEERIRTDTDANYGDLLVTMLNIPAENEVASDSAVDEAAPSP
ncbi:hypothetical protein BBP00_00003818 [Phytophthora kernoviae]|uniref:Annexin n=1 Tax=Phytophthora kernoviae TaxID=325452 RepID=A0A3F2RTD6_9STRA|nr:hypothetical protein BBP00_00003818 [Phytophthora kernoviae]